MTQMQIIDLIPGTQENNKNKNPPLQAYSANTSELVLLMPFRFSIFPSKDN